MYNKKRPKSPSWGISSDDQLTLWEDVVSVFVSENQFSVDLKCKVFSFLKEKQYSELLSLAGALSRTVYADEHTHMLMHQLASLIRKANFLPLGINLEERTRAKLARVERRNRLVNLIMKRRRAVPGPWDQDLHEIRSFIVSVLSKGEKKDETGFRDPSPNLESIFSKCAFTGGATVGVTGNQTNILRKLDAKWTVTGSCLSYFAAAIGANPLIAEYILSGQNPDYVCWDPAELIRRILHRCEVIDYNKFSVVPKTSEISRDIATEPDGNLFCQTGINAELRLKLRAIGVDLSNQSRNQQMALKAFTDRGWCTIDLSDASNTIVYQLIWDFFPDEWAELMDRVRAPFTRDAKGQLIARERFVSMGDGFCFPLQALIFSAICHVASKRCGGSGRTDDFAVYGDDIIVRPEAFSETITLLRRFGFKPNPKKTFSDGPFRESCGVDSYLGVDVRPIEVKGLENLHKVYNLHNQSIRRKYLTKVFTGVRSVLRNFVREKFNQGYFLCPVDPEVARDEHGNPVDGGFWAPLDECMSLPNTKIRWLVETQSWEVKLLTPRPPRDKGDDLQNCNVGRYALLYAALTGGSSRTPFVKRYSAVSNPRWFAAHGCGWVPQQIIRL